MDLERLLRGIALKKSLYESGRRPNDKMRDKRRSVIAVPVASEPNKRRILQDVAMHRRERNIRSSFQIKAGWMCPRDFGCANFIGLFAVESPPK